MPVLEEDLKSLYAVYIYDMFFKRGYGNRPLENRQEKR